MTTSTDLEVLLRDAPLPLIAARIRRARKAKGWSHDKLGAAMGGVTRQHLIKLEKGNHRPRLETIERISEATGRSVDWFLDPNLDPSPFPNELAA